MAVQTGIVPLVGTIGNINFYKREGQYLARGKVGVTAERIAIDPKFDRSRENAAEFGTASKAGKLLRTAFHSLLGPGIDMRMVRRLASTMVQVLQTDTSSARGMRKVFNGRAALLEGFEFNEPGTLHTTLAAPYATDIDRVTGEIKIAIPPFIPGDMVTATPAATHFKLTSGSAALDFENNTFTVDLHSSTELLLNNEETAEIVLNNKLAANSTHPIVVVLGIEFFQEVNGHMYPLKDRAFNAGAIVKVSDVSK